MYYYEIALSRVVRADQNTFTYSSTSERAIGSLVRVSVGKAEANGVIWKRVAKPSFATKPILSQLESSPLPPHLLRLAEWLSSYYSTHLATVLQTLLPSGLHKKRRQRQLPRLTSERMRTHIVLNAEQQSAITRILEADPGTVLLKGVTGSGKTRVYIEVAKKLVASRKSSIILVPEIALTPQLVAEFRQDFDDEQLIVTHSGMSEADRHLVWRTCLESTEPLIVIGPRSALFSPLANLGLIVIDEAHEPSFKQDQAPRYNSARAAAIVAKAAGVKVVLGSATPSVTDYYVASSNGRSIISLNHPAQANVTAPTIEVVSFLQRNNFSRHRFISNQLFAEIEKALAANAQVLLFHNRRGSAPLTICDRCGWTALCPTCYVPLTLHVDQHLLVCHLCNFHQTIPPNCPVCHHAGLIHKGIGTKLIADEVQKLFPKIRLARFDADNSLEETLGANYQALYDGSIQIIIGTQLVAKGLDLPNLRVVGVLQAESGLFLPDFQAEERVFQLLYQVAGRVGRQSNSQTSVVVQTYLPNHPVIHLGLQKDYDAFYDYALGERKKALFPPFTYLLRLTCSYASEAAAIKATRALAKKLKTDYSDIRILGPTPAFYERLNGAYRWQLIVKSPHRHTLQSIANQTPQAWYVDLDPHSLL